MTRSRGAPIGGPPARFWRRAAGNLWQCPECGKTYPRAGQGHSCVVIELKHHFHSRSPEVRALFDAVCATIEEVGGPFRLSIAKTRIGLIARMTFASVHVRKQLVRASFLLKRRLQSVRVARVEHVPPYWVHTVDIHHQRDIDADLRAWLRECYQSCLVSRDLSQEARRPGAR
jgi:hypothetical protein